jgi:hypothetical protein
MSGQRPGRRGCMGASPASNHRSGGAPPFGHVDGDGLRLNGEWSLCWCGFDNGDSLVKVYRPRVGKVALTSGRVSSLVPYDTFKDSSKSFVLRH